METKSLSIVGVRVGLAGCAVLMSLWVGLPRPGIAAIALASLSRVLIECAPVRHRSGIDPAGLALAWICTVLAPWAPLVAAEAVSYPGNYHAVVAGLVAVCLLPVGKERPGSASHTRWRIVAMVWAFFGGLTFLAASYVHNRPAAFHAAVGIVSALLILSRRWFRIPGVGIQAIHTALLLLIGIPAADFLLSKPSMEQSGPEVEAAYSYETAKKEPGAFGPWWRKFLAQSVELTKGIMMPDTTGIAGLRPRPNSQCLFFESRISINSHGYRGEEFEFDKGVRYRIVALGESTTFGITLKPGDRPWPEVLEEMIRVRLNPDRPVQIINAGVPSYNLRQNILRLRHEILALKPDLIISYHGYNGFPFIYAALPPVTGRPLPVYQHRPVKLLADFEFRIRMDWFKRRESWKQALIRRPAADPMNSIYANAYRELIDICRANNIRLVLANYSMAVNERSGADVVSFYKEGFPDVALQIKANEAHSMIVERLAAQHPEVLFVDTRPGVDGNPDLFIDLMHFTQEGRDRMAETFFDRISSLFPTQAALLEMEH